MKQSKGVRRLRLPRLPRRLEQLPDRRHARQSERPIRARRCVESIGLAGAMRRGNPKSKVQIIELSDFQCPTCGEGAQEGRADHRQEPRQGRLLPPRSPALRASRVGARRRPRRARAVRRWRRRSTGTTSTSSSRTRRRSASSRSTRSSRISSRTTTSNWKAVEKIYKSPAERKALLDQVSRAFDNGVLSTPTYIINGQMHGLRPRGNVHDRRDQEGAGGEVAQQFILSRRSDGEGSGN